MAAVRITDDLGRQLVLPAPSRVVSLVPSDTYSLQALGCGDRLVGITDYCDPSPGVEAARVGGPGHPRLEDILALRPDLVLANQDETPRWLLERLAQPNLDGTRVALYVSLPRRFADGVAHLARLAKVLGVSGGEQARALLRRGYDEISRPPWPVWATAFLPIWHDPWTTLNDETFGADMLRRVGMANVFGERPALRRLAMDLAGKASPAGEGAADSRQPRVALADIVARAPRLAVLPDEPYVFGDAEATELIAAMPELRVSHVAGKDLFWPGAWSIEAAPRLRAWAKQLRPEGSP